MLIKMDMKNAFDRVKLPFLYDVLLSFGFCSEFVSPIKGCIDGSWLSPLVNGRPSDFFKYSRGPHQGFSMSPFLYILMSETLSRKLIFENEAGYIMGIRIARGVGPINHALFIDDSLLLGGASMNISQYFL